MGPAIPGHTGVVRLSISKEEKSREEYSRLMSAEVETVLQVVSRDTAPVLPPGKV